MCPCLRASHLTSCEALPRSLSFGSPSARAAWDPTGAYDRASGAQASSDLESVLISVPQHNHPIPVPQSSPH